MSTIDKPHVSLGTLRRHLRGVPVIGPGEEGWDPARQAFNTDRRPAPGADRDAARRGRHRRRRALRRRRRPADRPAAHRPQRRPARRPRRQHPAQDRPAPGRQDRRREPHAPACAPAPSGRRSSRAPPTSASPRCTARRRTSASPATRSAAASAGTAASTAWPRTASPRSSSSPPTASCAASTRENEPELFWALRGGGGNFGVVTALEFDLYPVSEVYAGVLFFPYERSSEVLHAWREWTAKRARTRSPRSAACSSSRRSRTLPDVPARQVVRRRRGRRSSAPRPTAARC